MTCAALLLFLAAFGTLLALLYVFVLSFTEEHLPYVACFVFVVYYVWSSYSSFTKTYHDLALAFILLQQEFKTRPGQKLTPQL